MPWSPQDFPKEMKKLSPEARRHAVAVANRQLKSGSDEVSAISQGITAAREQFPERKKRQSTERELFLSQIPE